MKEQELFIENIKEIRNYWIKTSEKALEDISSVDWSNKINEYKILRDKLITNESQIAYKEVLTEIIDGLIHSLLVMLDNGDKLSDNLPLDIVNLETNKSIKNQTALHEEYFSSLE